MSFEDVEFKPAPVSKKELPVDEKAIREAGQTTTTWISYPLKRRVGILSWCPCGYSRRPERIVCVGCLSQPGMTDKLATVFNLKLDRATRRAAMQEMLDFAASRKRAAFIPKKARKG